MRAPIAVLALLGCRHPAPAPGPAPGPAPAPAPPGCRGFPPESLVVFTNDGDTQRAQLVAEAPDLDTPEPGEPTLNHWPVDLDGDSHDDLIVTFDCGDDRKCNKGAYVHCDATRWIRVWGPRYTNQLRLADTHTAVGGSSWLDLIESEGETCDDTVETTWKFDGRAYRADPASRHPASCR